MGKIKLKIPVNHEGVIHPEDSVVDWGDE